MLIMSLKRVLLLSLALVVEFRRNVFGTEEETVQSQLFVDKTSLIKLFFDMNYHTLLISVPKGFGKTTNMDMIRRFCEIQVDEEGCLISKNNTKYFKIFSSLYFKGKVSSFLDVYEDKQFFNYFFAQYPVLYLDFKLLGFKSWGEFKASIVKTVNEVFNYHRYLLSSKIFCDGEKVMFRNYQLGVICQELEPLQLKKSLKFLASMLYKYFNQKIVLFVDEVDSVVHNQIMNDCKDTEEIITFMTDLMSFTLNSNFITKALLCSSSRLSRVILKEVKNIDYFTFLEKHPFSQFYGFKENEVFNLAKNLNLENNMSTIRDWYNGYKMAKSDLKMYSFHSISNVMYRKDIDTYSKKGKYPEKFENLFLNKEVRRKIKKLIGNGVINVRAIKEVSVEDVLRLKEIFNVNKPIDFHLKDESLLFDYMLNLGYLTIDEYNEHGSNLRLKVPNMESKSELLDLTYSMSYFKTKLNLTDEEFLMVNETSLDRKMSMFLKEPNSPSLHKSDLA